MNKLILLLNIFVVILLLQGCSNNTPSSAIHQNTLNEATKSISDTKIDDISSTLNSLIENSFDIRCLYFVSAEQLYDWNNTKNVIEKNGMTYHLVTAEQFPTYQDFSNYIHSVFVDDYAKKYLNNDEYINIKNKLYTLGGVAGTNYIYSKYSYKIINHNDNVIEIELKIPCGESDEDISTMKFENIDGTWKIAYEAYGNILEINEMKE